MVKKQLKKQLKKGGNWAGPFPRIEDGDSYSKDIVMSLLRGKDLGSIKFIIQPTTAILYNAGCKTILKLGQKINKNTNNGTNSHEN